MAVRQLVRSVHRAGPGSLRATLFYPADPAGVDGARLTGIVPPAPGLLCALGCLLSDLRADFVASVWRETAALPADELRAIFARLEDEARAWLAEQKVALERVYLLRSADLCYVGQSFEVNVPSPELTDPGTKLAPAAMVEWFQRSANFQCIKHAPIP